MFDSSIGAGSVVMPYGGQYQLTETQSMVAKAAGDERKDRQCNDDELRL